MKATKHATALLCLFSLARIGNADEIKIGKITGGGQNYIPTASVMQESTLNDLLRKTYWYGPERSAPDPGDKVFKWVPSISNFVASSFDELDFSWNPNLTIKPGDTLYYYANGGDTNICIYASNTDKWFDAYQLGTLYTGTVTNIFNSSFNFFGGGSGSWASNYVTTNLNSSGFKLGDQIWELGFEVSPCYPPDGLQLRHELVSVSPITWYVYEPDPTNGWSYGGNIWYTNSTGPWLTKPFSYGLVPADPNNRFLIMQH